MKKRVLAAAVASAIAASMAVSAYAVDPGATNGEAAVEATVAAGEATKLTTDTSVEVVISADALPEGTEVELKTNTTAAENATGTVKEAIETAASTIESALTEAIAQVLGVAADSAEAKAAAPITVNTKLEITLVDKATGKPVEPNENGKVTVTVPYDGKSNAVAYVDGSKVEIMKLSVNGDVATFETSHFSDYYLVEVSETVLNNIDEVVKVGPITVTPSGSGNTDTNTGDDKNQSTGVAIAVIPAIAAAAAVVASKKRK